MGHRLFWVGSSDICCAAAFRATAIWAVSGDPNAATGFSPAFVATGCGADPRWAVGAFGVGQAFHVEDDEVTPEVNLLGLAGAVGHRLLSQQPAGLRPCTEETT
jgi:hypothetical protein